MIITLYVRSCLENCYVHYIVHVVPSCFYSFFSARQHNAIARYLLSPVRLSVRVSDTRVDQSKTVEVGSCNFHHRVAP